MSDEVAPVPAPAAGDLALSPPDEPDLLLTVHDAHAKIAYWELGAGSIARGRALDPDGRAVLRLVSMKASWDGAERFEQEFEVDGLVGRRALLLPEGSSQARAAIGWSSKAGFLPLAVALEFGPSGEIEFRPPATSDEHVARALAHARNARGIAVA
jgi:hypothetical protein